MTKENTCIDNPCKDGNLYNPATGDCSLKCIDNCFICVDAKTCNLCNVNKFIYLFIFIKDGFGY